MRELDLLSQARYRYFEKAELCFKLSILVFRLQNEHWSCVVGDMLAILLERTEKLDAEVSLHQRTQTAFTYHVPPPTNPPHRATFFVILRARAIPRVHAYFNPHKLSQVSFY